jgi:hypothetical protein
MKVTCTVLLFTLSNLHCIPAGISNGTSSFDEGKILELSTTAAGKRESAIGKAVIL